MLQVLTTEWPNTLDETPHLDGMARHIWGLPSDPCRLNLDSSEKITLSHCACVHLACSLAHCSLAVIIFSVSSGLCWGCLAANPPLNKRLLTVLALTFMPEDSSSRPHFKSVYYAVLSFTLIHINVLSADLVVASLQFLALTRSILPVLACIWRNFTTTHWLVFLSHCLELCMSYSCSCHQPPSSLLQ